MNFTVMKFSISKDHLILMYYTEAIIDNIFHIKNGTYGLSKRVSIIFNIFIRKFYKGVKVNHIYIINKLYLSRSLK